MSRDQALERELDHLIAVNSAVDNLLETVGKCTSDVALSKQNTDTSSALLEDWIKILSQTRFATQALRNPEWKGAYETEISEETDAILREEEQMEKELLRLHAENEKLERSLQSRGSPKRTPKRARR